MWNIFKLTFWVDVLKLSRLNNLIIIFITQYGGAIFLCHYHQSPMLVLANQRFFVMVVSTLLIATAGYFINDYYDIKIDLINKPNKVIVGQKIRRRPVLMAHALLNITGIGLGLWVSVWVGLVNLCASFLLWLYSNHLKQCPFIGNLLVAFLTAFSLLTVSVFYHNSNLLLFTYSFFAFGITLIREIIKDVEDVEGDTHYGGKTLPIVIGVRQTKYLLFILLGLYAIVLSILLIKINLLYLTGYFLVLVGPFFHFSYTLYRADTKQAYSYLSSYSKWLIMAGILSMIILSV